MNTRDGTVKGVIEGEEKPFNEMWVKSFSYKVMLQPNYLLYVGNIGF